MPSARLKSASSNSRSGSWYRIVSRRKEMGILNLGIDYLDAIGWNSTSLNTQISRLPRRPNHPRMPLALPIGTLASSR